MPVPKRYFHCSQDIIADPEMWAFTEQFGDRALRTWLQILIYLDRSSNHWRVTGDWVAVLSRTVRQSPANLRRQIGWLSVNGWLIADESSADGSPLVYMSPNWLKYNRSREHKRIGTAPDMGALRDPLLSDPFPSSPHPIPTPKKKKEEEKNKITATAMPCGPGESVATWAAYARAYQARYGAAPVRNASVNAMLKNLIKKLGAESAPEVAAFYVGHNAPFYVAKRHPVSVLVHDAEGLHTQWITGIKSTTGEAKNAEVIDDARAQIARVEARLKLRQQGDAT